MTARYSWIDDLIVGLRDIRKVVVYFQILKFFSLF